MLLTTALFLGCDSYVKLKEGKEVTTATYSGSIKSRYRGCDNIKRPGYGIMVLKDGKIEHTAGYGMADLDEKKPILPQTKFQSWVLFHESVKISLLKLWDQGKIDMESPISKYITYLPEVYSAVKIKHIIGQTSGFPDINTNTLTGVKTPKEILELVTKNQEVLFEPGTDGSFYSFWGEESSMIEIIEKVTGEDIVTYLNREVFKKLEMNSTKIYSESSFNESEVKYYKRRNKNLIPQPESSWTAVGAGTTITNMEDLAKFFNAIDNVEFISNKVHFKYTEISKLDDGSDALFKDNQYAQYFDLYFSPSGSLSIDKATGDMGMFLGGDDQATHYMPDAGYRVFVMTNMPDGVADDTIFNKVLPAIFQ